MNEKILITSALPYANGPLHFGHIAGAYLPADCYARFERLQKKDVLYICGSDEYGIAITLSAELARRSPKEHVDIFHKINQELFKKLNFSFDHFSRTTCKEHVPIVQQFFTDLYEKGFIEEQETLQLYSEEDRRFLADRYVVGECPFCKFDQARGDECQKCGASYEATDLKNPCSKMTGAPLVTKKTNHFFLRLDLFKERLKKWLDQKDWKVNVKNFAMKYIEELRPRAITRDMEWGVPLPLKGYEGKVLYVWFDAPIGYISATMELGNLRGEPDLWKKYWLSEETKLVHFIGKDNIPFHAVVFPAMVMGQNLPLKLVDDLPANEFYNLEGRQFSKSDGWTIDLEDFFRKFSTDQIRYTIAATAPETSDSEFTWKEFQNKCNADLLGKFGNFANRTLVFACKSFEGKVPKTQELNVDDLAFLQACKNTVHKIRQAYSKYRLRDATKAIMELASLGNAYFDAKAPWKGIKNQEGIQDAKNTVALCVEALKLLALVSFPIIPESAEKLWKMLGFSQNLTSFDLTSLGWDGVEHLEIPAGQAFGTIEILFQKVEDEMIACEAINLCR